MLGNSQSSSHEGTSGVSARDERGMVAPELFFLFWSGKFGILTQNEV